MRYSAQAFATVFQVSALVGVPQLAASDTVICRAVEGEFVCEPAPQQQPGDGTTADASAEQSWGAKQAQEATEQASQVEEAQSTAEVPSQDDPNVSKQMRAIIDRVGVEGARKLIQEYEAQEGEM